MNNLLKIAPTIQAAALVNRTAKRATKKQKPEDFLASATEVLVGSSLIKLESDFINSL